MWRHTKVALISIVLLSAVPTQVGAAQDGQTTVVAHEEGMSPWGLAQLPDGRVLVGNFNATITMLEGFPPALMGPKPAAKPPKKKRGLAGGASASSSGGASSSSGPALKRGRSGAGPSNAAAADSSSSSEDEGAGAEAEPLV